MKCLDSLRESGTFQLVIFENGIPLSESVKDYLKTYPAEVVAGGSAVQLTPGRARNEALLLATGEWVHFIDDDSYWIPGYWKIVQPLLSKPEIDVLGGPDGPAKAMNNFQQSVSLALASPLCTGMTYGRHLPVGDSLSRATEERLTSCNLWVRRNLLKERPFPEDFKRAEETVLLLELQKEGRRMYYHPKLRVGHHRRKNLQAMLRPMVGAGYWRSRLLRKSEVPGVMYWLPAVFVLLHLTVLVSPSLFLTMAKVYAMIIAWVSVGLCLQRNHVNKIFQVIVLHYLIVFFYGAGFIMERLGVEWKN